MFVDSVVREAELWSRRLQQPKVETVFFGGGTPSLLTLPQFEKISNALQANYRIADKAEFTVEANPESARSLEYLSGLRSLGVNRLSLGAQSFDGGFLRMLGRPHTPGMVVEAYSAARMAEIVNVSLDLMWGLPGQRLKLWLDDLKRAVKLGPSHLSCYGLTLEPDTRLEQRCLSGELEFPGEDELSKMYVYGADYLESVGYLQYEISNFAKMGFSSRHNMGYWEGKEYLGLGPSAVSTVLDRRWTNPDDLEEYAEAAKTAMLGKDPERLTPQNKLRELIMLSLRTNRGLRLKEYTALAGSDFLKDFEPLVRAMHRNDLIRISKGRLRLTRGGMAVSNAILENIFSRLDSLGK